MTLWLRYKRPDDLADKPFWRTYHDKKRNHVYPAARNLDLEPCPTIMAGGVALAGLNEYWIEFVDDLVPLSLQSTRAGQTD